MDGWSFHLPGADDCRNFSETFIFCPRGPKRRAESRLEENQKHPCRHPLLVAYEFQELLDVRVVDSQPGLPDGMD